MVKKFKEGCTYIVVEKGLNQRGRIFRFINGAQKENGRVDSENAFHFYDDFILPKWCKKKPHFHYAKTENEKSYCGRVNCNMRGRNVRERRM